MLSGIRRVSNDIEFTYAYNNLRATQLVGVVDRFDESMVVFEDELKKYFPQIDLSYIAQNVNQKEKKTLGEKQEEIRVLLGDKLFEQYKDANKNDEKLYTFANSLLDERIKNIENFDIKLTNFLERCKILRSKRN